MKAVGKLHTVISENMNSCIRTWNVLSIVSFSKCCILLCHNMRDNIWKKINSSSHLWVRRISNISIILKILFWFHILSSLSLSFWVDFMSAFSSILSAGDLLHFWVQQSFTSSQMESKPMLFSQSKGSWRVTLNSLHLVPLVISCFCLIQHETVSIEPKLVQQ